MRSEIVRFAEKITIGHKSGCWLWCGSKNHGGYGRFWCGNKQGSAHRWSYEHFVGPIPSEMQIDHLCRNPSCVNPDHLEPVSSRENVLRGETVVARNLKKSQCPAGHVYDDLNTYTDAQRRRHCRTCHREQQRAYLSRRGGAS